MTCVVRYHFQEKISLLLREKFKVRHRCTQRIALSQVADSIEIFCAKIRPILEQANFDQKRQLVELLVDHVVVTNGDVEIHCVIPTQPEGPQIPFSHLCLDYRSLSRRRQGRGAGSVSTAELRGDRTTYRLSLCSKIS